jgi:ankyrin repeat protein
VLARSSSAVCFVCLVVAAGSSVAQSQSGTSASNAAIPSDGLRLAIEFEGGNQASKTLDFDERFGVVISNVGKDTLRIFSPFAESAGGQWTLHFQSADEGQSRIVEKRRRPADPSDKAGSTTNLLDNVITLAPGKHTRMYVVLSDNSYPDDADRLVWKNLPGPNAPGEFQLSVALEYAVTAEAVKAQIWTGKVESPKVAVRLQSPRLKTPVDLLWRGFAEAALEELKRDRTSINKVDREYRCAALHHASRFGHLEVVEWLVANGANVNAVAYNRFTPLYFAERPEIVQAILKGNPNLEAETWDGTHLERAAMNVADARSDEARDRWLEIVQLLRAAGARSTLKTAIYLNDVEAVRKLVDASSDAAPTTEFHSPLRLAAKYGRLEICKMLLEVPGVDVDQFDAGSGYPVIKEALKFPAVVRLFIEHKADLRKRITYSGGRSGYWPIRDNATLLHYAALDGVPETIKLLIDNGVEIFAEAHDELLDSEVKQTALEVASMWGRGDNVVAIIEHPKFKAAPDLVRWEPLNDCLIELSGSASDSEGDLRKWITTLVAEGADIKRRGLEAVQSAAGRIHPTHEKENQRCREAITVLRELGAEIDLPSAVAFGDEVLVAELLAKSPESANALCKNGVPALHRAVQLNFDKIVALLLKSGCDVDIANQAEHSGSQGETALAEAAFWRRPEIAKLLIENGANVHAADLEGRTPLFDAARMKSLAIVRLLLENGAEIDVKDANGKTPLDWAGGNLEVRELFEEFRKR